MPSARPAPSSRSVADNAARWLALLGLVAVTGCASSSAQAPDRAEGSPSASASALGEEPAPPSADAAAVPTEDTAGDGQAAARNRPPVALPVAPLATRLRPDVLVRGKRTFSVGGVGKLAALSPDGGAIAFRAGTVRVADQDVPAVGVDPSSFRAFAAKGTAEATAVWQAVARGEAVASHDAAKRLGLELGKEVPVAPKADGTPQVLRIGAFATIGVPGTDLVLDDGTARSLGIPSSTGMLLTSKKDGDPVALADQVRAIVGDGATVDLLTQPAANPVAFLTGSKAAKAFGAFSYRYFPDGTIQPDAKWVRQNIVTANVPIMGRVTCHRLMVPQLRGALQDVQDAGLGHLLKTYDGCYVPRFIARNPDNSISLHTWGIAIDMDASTNYRGIRGTMDMRIVNIFKRWGFRWGGDWTYTDPMHFEMGALLTDGPKG